MRPHLWLIKFIGVIVPRRLRAGWRQEWEAELRYREMQLAEWNSLSRRNKLALLWHSLGALIDALSLQPRRREDEMIQDLRFGLRMMQKNKVFTAVAVLSLAMGIGANTAVFSLLDALLLKPLPVEHPEQLVKVGGISYKYPDPVYRELSEKNTVFSGIFTFNWIEATLSDGDRADRVLGELVSGDFYKVLGVGAHLGRVFTAADDQTPGAHFVTVISYDYWRRRFGADPSIIGKKISINNHPFTIIGVSAQGFNDVEVGVAPAPDIRVPMMMKSLMFDPRDDTPVMARLKPGVSIEQAQIATEALFQNIIRAYGANLPANRYTKADRIELRSASTGFSAYGFGSAIAQPFVFLMCLVGVVLLIACLNVANLLLARAVTRQKEIAVRMAVGAGRLRLIRQLLTEGILLSVLGGGFGLMFARLGKYVLLGFLPPTSTLDVRLDLAPASTLDINLDWRLLGFTFAVTIMTGLLFGMAPAMQATRINLIPALKNDAAVAAGDRRKWKLQHLLIILQVALSLVLLVSGGLFVRSFQKLKAVDPGYTSDQIVSMTLAPDRNGYKPDQMQRFYDQLSERIKTLPGVKAVTYASRLPLGGISSEGPIEVPGSHIPPNEKPSTHYVGTSPQFFATFGIPLLRGRDFTVQDTVGPPRVIIINDSFAHYFYGDENPLGKRISVGPFKELEIVGVVGTAKLDSLKEMMSRTLYYADFGPLLGKRRMAVRAIGEPAALIAAIRREVSRIDPNLPVYEIKTFAEQIDGSIGRERLIALLSSFFGLFALLLAGLGLYGVMTYAVARRTREIGIRMALGAQAGNVLWLVLRETLLLVSMGLVIGLPAALAAARLTRSLLFGLTTSDPLTIAIATSVMIAIAAAAGYLPARRAAQVDPMVALRED